MVNLQFELLGIVTTLFAVIVSSQQRRRSGLDSTSILLILLGSFLVFYGASVKDDFFGLPTDIGTVASYVTVVGGIIGVMTYYIRAQIQNIRHDITNLGHTLRGEFNRELGEVKTDIAVLKERTKNLPK